MIAEIAIIGAEIMIETVAIEANGIIRSAIVEIIVGAVTTDVKEVEALTIFDINKIML